MYLNKAFILGNLTRDPEIRALPSGADVASFSLATNRVWKDRDGNKQEDVDYHNIVVFGKQAAAVADFLKKGSSALVEGRITTRSWESDGVKKYRTEIVAERVQFGPRKTQSVEKKEEDVQADAPQETTYPEGYPSPDSEDIDPNSIPF